ncbi:hypothetical protein [Mycobacterium sp.]|uniref:hypothetical protein n=1 Tax=Mycobacterium sp. TaxID=1785 RepID=UPI003F9A54CF
MSTAGGFTGPKVAAVPSSTTKVSHRALLSVAGKIGHHQQPERAEQRIQWCRAAAHDEEGESGRNRHHDRRTDGAPQRVVLRILGMQLLQSRPDRRDPDQHDWMIKLSPSGSALTTSFLVRRPHDGISTDAP